MYSFIDCVYLGESYMSGDVFDKGDNCNTCKCLADGSVQCSAKSCFSSNFFFSFFFFFFFLSKYLYSFFFVLSKYLYLFFFFFSVNACNSSSFFIFLLRIINVVIKLVSNVFLHFLFFSNV